MYPVACGCRLGWKLKSRIGVDMLLIIYSGSGMCAMVISSKLSVVGKASMFRLGHW